MKHHLLASGCPIQPLKRDGRQAGDRRGTYKSSTLSIKSKNQIKVDWATILVEIENQLSQQQHKLKGIQKRSEKLTEHIETTESVLQEQRRLEGGLNNEVKISKTQTDALQNKLDKIHKKLGDTRISKNEDSRCRKHKKLSRIWNASPAVFTTASSNCANRSINV